MTTRALPWAPGWGLRMRGGPLLRNSLLDGGAPSLGLDVSLWHLVKDPLTDLMEKRRGL